ncbi:MAG TPA: RHS repeat-associated core domain-containing protein [Trebonia sp.]|jgi:RHS repeat-associated protein|nr:RHS repeat-associated core domain-containing protein [Trebonia sp.]
MAVSPDGSVTASTYDHLGELTSTTNGAGDTTSYQYDDQGNQSDVTYPDGTSEEYGYDEADQLTSAADFGTSSPGVGAAQLRSESFGYDADGDQTSATDWDGNTTSETYDAAGELTGKVQPVSSSSSITTSYGYDAAGNPTSVTDGNGNTTWTTYNAWNLPESVIEPVTSTAPDPSDTTWTTAYNADGEPATVTEPGGVSLSYGYDPLGDITSESGSGATASTPDRSFTYDEDQRMTSATSGVGTDSFTYNADSDLKTAAGPSGTSSYDYDNDGLVSSETDAAGTTSYTYDSADRLSTESDPLTGATLTWAYNADSNPTSISYATNGTAGPVQSYGYNELQQQTSDTLTSATGSVLASEAYGYDEDGNVTSQATGGGLADTSATYAYDKADRLTSAISGGTTTAYAYDGDGNLTQDGSTTSTYNAQDQLTASTSPPGTTSYSYTLNGSTASVTPPSGPAQDYTWDAYGDLASAGGVAYGYDALGRMVTSTDSSGTADLSYLGNGDTIASDGTSEYSYDPSGNLTATGSSSGAFATVSDEHGDLTAMFSPTSSTENLAGNESYTPYGSGTKANYDAENIGYQGDYTDPTTGLVYMNARWYNPANGSFVSSDTLNGTPIPSTVDGNPYAYADSNPLTDTDPTGHDYIIGEGDGMAGVVPGSAGPGVLEDLGDGLEDAGRGIGDAWDDLFSDGDGSSEADDPGDETSSEGPAEDEFEDEMEDADKFKEAEEESGLEDEDADDGSNEPSSNGLGSYDWDLGEAEFGDGGADGDGSSAAEPVTEPPQDAYASGDAQAPSAPTELLDAPYITSNTTAPADLVDGDIPASDEITEHLTDTKTDTRIQGTQESSTQAEQHALQQASQTSTGNSSLPSQTVSAVGKPVTPLPGDEEEQGENGCGSGGPSWVNYLPLNDGRAQGVMACLAKGGFNYIDKNGNLQLPDNGSSIIGSPAPWPPGSPGYDQSIPKGWYPGSGYQRGHLLGRQLGGTGTNVENLVPLWPKANSPVMSGYEGQVANYIKNGVTVYYSATPVYSGNSPVPTKVDLSGFAVTPAGSLPLLVDKPDGQLAPLVDLPIMNTPSGT